MAAVDSKGVVKCPCVLHERYEHLGLILSLFETVWPSPSIKLDEQAIRPLPPPEHRGKAIENLARSIS